MERDFMGLSVKHETPDEPIDAAPLRSSAMKWSFSNKTSALPQLLSFQDEKPKTGFDSLASTGLVTITTTEAFDSGVVQKTVVPEKQGGVRYTVTTYPSKHLDGHAIHRPVSSQTNLTVSPAISACVHHSFLAPAGQNVIRPICAQPLAAVPMPNPVPAMPFSSPVVGTTDLRNISKISGAPAQLTIFYNGSVCVYDSISPEKAQAIMLLAGNGPPSTSSATVPAAPVQAPMPMPTVLESFTVSHPYDTTPNRSSTTTVKPVSVSQSVSWSGTINKTTASKQGSILVTSKKVEPLKVVNLPGSVSTILRSSDTVPQFRRKSLARFLEKRKERAIDVSPIGNKQSPDCNSSGSCPLSAIN